MGMGIWTVISQTLLPKLHSPNPVSFSALKPSRYHFSKTMTDLIDWENVKEKMDEATAIGIPPCPKSAIYSMTQENWY